MDCSAIILNKLISEKNSDIWAKLKLSFIDPAYSSIYSAITRYYERYSIIPNFEELELFLRDKPGLKLLGTIKLVDVTDIPTDVALDALIDQFTQNETLRLLDQFVDELPKLESSEVKEKLTSIVTVLDEKTITTESVMSMSDMLIFRQQEEISKDRFFLGINNSFDAALSGVARQELIYLGGMRGSGKSLIGANISVNQYLQGNTSVFFTIEMTALETYHRMMAIIANVHAKNLAVGKSSEEDILKIVKARADMFADANDLVQEYIATKDRFKFEENLIRQKTLKDNQIVIIDDRNLSISSIDLHLGKLKHKFGDKFSVAVIDYVNQVVPDNPSDKYDWKSQLHVSAQLKNLARKHDIVIVSPYQIDSTGEARFSKGILDSADISLILEAHDKDSGAISMQSTKLRSDREQKFTSGINWDTLKISPVDVQPPEAKKKNKTEKTEKTSESHSEDVPW